MAANIENITPEVGVEKKRFRIFRNKKIWIIGAVVIVAGIFIAKAMLSKPAGKAVTISDVTSKDIVQSISVTGNIKANQEDKTLLSVTQKVEEVMVKEGQDVKKGTPLVKLDTSDLEEQLKKALIALNSAQSNYTNGEKTVQDAVIQAQINLQSGQSAYEQSKRTFDANQALYDGGYISKETYEDSKKKLTDAENQLKLLQIQLDNANKNLSDYDKSSSLKQQIDLAKADVDSLNKKIADSTIVANIDGKVVRLDAEAGQYPKSDRNTVMVCDLSSYKVVISLNQYDSVRVKVGQKANLKIKGLDKEYTGTVSKIGEIANVTSSGSDQESKVDIEITVDNPDENIKVGYEADADIILNEKKGALNVNFEAVRQDEQGKYVFVVENGLAKKRYVKTGLETDFDIEILEGLKEGEKYISVPDDTIKDGDAVIVPGGNKK